MRLCRIVFALLVCAGMASFFLGLAAAQAPAPAPAKAANGATSVAPKAEGNLAQVMRGHLVRELKCHFFRTGQGSRRSEARR